MIFSGVKLPDEIGIALEEGRLVIFAGAGVSFPPPSTIPLFNGLASKISGGCDVPKGAEDRFLGKLYRSGTDVHAAAVRETHHRGTQPTQLHREILGIFNAPEKVRVVTTNFDNHFSTAAQAVYGRSVPVEYCAPALPLGDDFYGIVYLHGAARLGPKGLVLTDKDYGQAYLTRGWARDFLVPLFSKYTVLFVGYSHGDVTTTYLARGLNQAEIKPRWTMVSSELKPEGRENWEHLEIKLTEYPVDPKNTVNTHQPLTDFFAQWALHAKETLFARAKRVKTIARGLPPESPEISEYLAYCLRHPRLAQDFCAAIRHPAWVGWLHKHGFFDAFFVGTSAAAKPLEPSQQLLARWLCTFVRRKHPELLLELIREHPTLTREFTHSLAHLVWSQQKKTPDSRYATWISILLAHGREGAPDSIWAYLLNECRLPRHLGVALGIFSLLTTPQIKTEQGIDWSALKKKGSSATKPTRNVTDFRIDWPREADHWIPKAWADIFRPKLGTIADKLSSIVVTQVTASHLLLRGVEKASERFDRLNMGRRSIAAHEQDSDPLDQVFSTLVDILRESLDHWMGAAPVIAKAHTETWWASGVPILRRLAAYAYAKDTQYSADDRLRWVLRHDLVFRSGLKKEIFDVLASGFGKASTKVQQRLLRRVQRGYAGPGYKKLEKESLAYEKFNVLVWLDRSSPNSPLLQEALKALRKAHPQFGEREYPELDSWGGKAGFIDPNKGVDFDRILREPPGQFLQAIRSVGENSHPHDRWDYYSNLTVLFARDKKWSQGFAAALAAEAKPDPGIWGAVFSAWKETIKTAKDWSGLLSIVEGLPKHEVVYAGAARLISQIIWKKDVGVSKGIIDRVVPLMNTAWKLCSTVNDKPTGDYRDWHTSAINHVGGEIGEFWIHLASHLRIRHKTKKAGIPKSLKTKMVDALSGTTQTKVYARLAMTPWMGYVYVWDRSFATKHFLPLLDWDRDPVVAQQTWSVLLNYNRGTSWELESELIPFYRQFAGRAMDTLKSVSEKSEQFDKHALQSLGHRLAGLAMKIIPNPVESGFFREFLPLLSESVRGAVANGMGDYLEKMSAAEQKKIWDTWLCGYLDQRLMGVPVALTVAETKHMVEWCLYLEPVFREAVDRVTQMKLGQVFAHKILADLLKLKKFKSLASHICRLANAVLAIEEHRYLDEEAVKLHDQLEKIIPDTAELTTLKEHLYVRGWNP